MKKILSSSIVIAIFLQGCATKPVQLVSSPGILKLGNMKRTLASGGTVETGNEAEEFAKNYLTALFALEKKQYSKACDLFEGLSEERAFALKDVALIRSLESCDYSERKLKKIWSRVTVPTYLKEYYFETSRQIAVAKKISDYEADFSYELSVFKPTQSEKIRLLQRSIEIAGQLKDDARLKLYNDKLKVVSPLHSEVIDNSNIYAVARDFESNRKFQKARELYRQMIDGDFKIEEKIKAFNAYRTSYKVERNLKTFLEKTFEMEQFLREEMHKHPDEVKTAEGWADTNIALARAVWTEHRNVEARKIIVDFLKSDSGNDNQKAQARYVFGSLLLEIRENEEALKKYEEASTYKITDQNLKENIQWAIVWNHYLLKNYDQLIRYADQFIKKSNNQVFNSKLSFWKAKAMLKKGKKAEAETILSNLAVTDEFGYYGLLAAMMSDSAIKPLPPASINTDSSGNNSLDWLIGLGEKTFAQKLLKEMDSQFKTQEQREKAMSLYALTEWYQGGMRQIYNFKQSLRNGMTEKYSTVVFPVPYFDKVQVLSEKYSVPKELIYGITRQESAFVPSERSWADAFGLMQMIPEKAQELSKKFQIPYSDYNDLYNPEINLEMGTALLKLMREKFNYKFAQTVASYNASESVIKVWEKERFNGDYIEFIEMIPYEETRNYIKLVFRNFITYKRIMTPVEFKIDKDFFSKPF